MLKRGGGSILVWDFLGWGLAVGGWGVGPYLNRHAYSPSFSTFGLRSVRPTATFAFERAASIRSRMLALELRFVLLAAGGLPLAIIMTREARGARVPDGDRGATRWW